MPSSSAKISSNSNSSNSSKAATLVREQKQQLPKHNQLSSASSSTTISNSISGVAKRSRATAPVTSRTSPNAVDLCVRDPPIMTIGASADSRTAVVPNGNSNSAPSVDLLESTASTARANDDTKQQLAVNSMKENGSLHNHNHAVHAHVLGVHRFNNRETADANDSNPAANERPTDVSVTNAPTAAGIPVDANGHALPPHHIRSAQHPFMHQHPHAGMIGLANAFEGLSVAPQHHPPGTHPHILHHPHQQIPPHHIAQHPHAHPPAMGPGPPPGMQPHPHPHLLAGPPGSQQLPPHHLSQSPPPHHLIPQHPQPTTMQMWVPQDRVGAVIGSQGAVIKALQDRSRATIQVHNETIRGERKLFTIVGGHAECQVARQLVMEIIERPRSSHSHGAPSGAVNSSNGPHSPNAPRGERGNFHQQEGGSDRAGVMSKTVFVPTSCVGLVIGRKGETIRELQTKSGAQIFVTRDRDATQGSHERSVLISGTEQAIHAATALVRDIVRDAQSRRQNQVPNHSRMPAAHGPILVETLTVPDDKVGLIIGKGGAAIRELQSMSGAKIQVAKEDEASSNSNTRPVTLTGVRSCIDAAKSLIAEKVNMHLPQTSSMQTCSPQQPAFVPPNAGLYYPVYDAGFPALSMQAPPYQQLPPPPPFDPNDPQQAQIRAFAYYHQFHHPGYYHAQQQLHQQMQQQQQQQRQANAEGQDQQHGGGEQQQQQSNETSAIGEQAAPEGKPVSEPGAGPSTQRDSSSPTMHHRNQPTIQFGIQDQPITLSSMGGAQSQGISHFARPAINMPPPQQQQAIPSQPQRRIMAQAAGAPPTTHFIATAAHTRVHHEQIQAHMATLQQMAHLAANAAQQQQQQSQVQQRANGASAKQELAEGHELSPGAATDEGKPPSKK